MAEPEKRYRGRPKGSRNKATKDARAMYDKLCKLHGFEAMDALFHIGKTEMAIYNKAILDGDLDARQTPGHKVILCAKELMPYYYKKPNIEVQEGEQGQLVFTFSPEARQVFEPVTDKKH